MKNGKKLTAVAAASAVASALVAPAAFAATTSFTDISGNFAADAINALAAKGILTGNPDGTFAPNGNITREQFAVVLSKALNLDASGTTTFADVDSWASGYVAAVVKAGIINGYDATHFGGKDNLNREQMATIFVRALTKQTGYDATGKGSKLTFSDASAISSWAKDSVGAAVELGLIHGMTDGSFAPAGNATRAQVALVANTFLAKVDELAKATLTSATLVNNSTITINFSKAVDSIAAADVAVASKADGKAVTVSNVVLSDDKKSATVSVTPLALSTTYTVTFGGKSVDVATAGQLQVSSVTALNANEIKVVFNAPVYETSAEDLSNYDFEWTDSAKTGGFKDSIDAAQLQDDKQTVILHSTTPLALGESFNLTVSGVLDVNFNTVEDYTSSNILFDDETAPTLSKAAASGKDVVVTFNEPVALDSDVSMIKIDGQVIDLSTVTAGSTVGAYTLTIADPGADFLSDGNHTVTVYNVYDIVGNKLPVATATYNTATNTQAPTVKSVTATGTNTFAIQFSEALAATPTVTLKNGTHAFSADNNDFTVAVDSDDDTIYNVTVTPQDTNNPLYASGVNSVTLNVGVTDLVDATDLIGADYNGTVTLSKNLNGPKVVAAGLNKANADANTLSVKFDEAIDGTSLDASAITVTQNNTIMPIASVALDPADTDNKTVVITLDTALAVGDYSVNFGDSALTDTEGNGNADLTTTVHYGTSGYLPIALGNGDAGTATLATGDTNVITVNYGHDMTDSAINLANYKFDGGAFPTGTKIAFYGDKQHVKITLPSAYFTNNTADQITITNAVTSTDGLTVNTSGGGTVRFLFSFSDNTKPELKTAQFYTPDLNASSTDTLELTFSEALATAGDADDYQVKVNGAVVGVATVEADATGTNKNVLVHLNKTINTSQAVTISIVPVGSDNATMSITDLNAGNTAKATTTAVTVSGKSNQ